jgi:hypothetical protein
MMTFETPTERETRIFFENLERDFARGMQDEEENRSHVMLGGVLFFLLGVVCCAIAITLLRAW